MDPKTAEYVPCPKCGGLGDALCGVCHGMKTIPKKMVDFGEGRMELVWTKSPVESLMEEDRLPLVFPEPLPPPEWELFSVGDRVRWSDQAMSTPVPRENDFTLHGCLCRFHQEMMQSFGNGPFIIECIFSGKEERKKDRPAYCRGIPIDVDGEYVHPQIFILKDFDGNLVPCNEPGRKIGAGWFKKV
ncbi:MAG: hypothetical protein AAB407_00015 [Patescibacteria group bacterium]